MTSAYCVLACWTPVAVRSVYVRAEAKKGLENNTLVPVFLEQCTLPVPFNAIDTDISPVGVARRTIQTGAVSYRK